MLGGAFSFGLANSISKAATRAISIKNYINTIINLLDNYSLLI